jgi:biotin carboxylase
MNERQMQTEVSTAPKGGILILEPQAVSLTIAQYCREQGYEPIVVTADRQAIEAVREPYRACLAAIAQWHIVDRWRPEPAFREEMARLVEKHRIVGVHARSELCLPAESEIRALLGLPHADATEIASWTDKLSLRRTLVEAGLSQLTCADPEAVLAAAAWPFAGEAIFKPRYGVDSMGVRRCRSQVEVEEALRFHRALLSEPLDDVVNRHYLREFDAGAFVEEAARGELMSVEGIVDAGRFHPLGITGRNLYSQNPVIELGFRFPYSPSARNAIIARAEAILAAIGYRNGAVHMEMMVDGAERIELIDFNPRLVGSDVMLAMNRAYDTRTEEFMLRLAIGREIAFDLATPRCYVDSRSFFADDAVRRFETITFPKHPQLIHALTRKAPGACLDARPKHVSGILGSYAVWGSTSDEAAAIADAIGTQIRINGEFGIDR